MSFPRTRSRVVQFGDFQFSIETTELIRKGRPVRLQPQPARLLRLLLLHAGELVTRDAIQAQLWDDGTSVDFELGVNRCARQLRAALLDDSEAPRYIKTIPRMGYAFIAPVSDKQEPVSDPQAPASERQQPLSHTPEARNPSVPVSSDSSTREREPSFSIAVLPFTNLSNVMEDEYFSDGLTEEITNTLGQIANLKVTARTSAFTFKGKSEDIRRIAEVLGVTHVLEGSVRRGGSRLRITAQLIQASDSSRLLSKRYDREMTDVLAVQDEISTDIANQLELRFAARDKPKTDLAAYEKFLEGRFHWHKYTPAGFDKALACYRQAIALDPEYGRAYAGIAEYYVVMVTDAGAPALEYLPKAADAARRALACNPEDADAHATLGQVAAMLDYDWTAAKSHFRRARESNAGPHARIAYIMWFLVPHGKTAEALAECDEVIQQDPLLLIGRCIQASVLLFARSNERGAECCLRVLDIEPDYGKALQLLSNARTFQGRHQESVLISERLVQIIGRSYLGLCNLALAQAAAGDSQGARSTLDEILSKLPLAGRGAPALVGCIYLFLGDRDSALTWMRRAVDLRDPRMLWMPAHPWTNTLRTDRRFIELIAGLNLAV